MSSGPASRLRTACAVGLVSCGGVGYVPWAPGTAGTLVGTAVALLTETEPMWQWGILAVTVLLGLACIPPAQRTFGSDDPREVVLDECCGALLTFVGLPLTPVVLLAGFVAFRVLDVWKPPPIRQLGKLPGAWGVLADDLAAGCLAHLLAWFISARV